MHKSLYLLLTGLIALALSCQSPEKRELQLHSLFMDHMVLQQDEDVAIWGEYIPGAKVNVKASWGADATAISNEQGKWDLKLATPVAGGPYSIDFTTMDKTISLKDVMIGEVWIGSGQSNMQMGLDGYMPNEPIDNYTEEIANANYPEIRMFNVEWNLSHSRVDTVGGEWQVCTPENAGAFSAAAYFFARKLNQDMGVPVGIIHTSWGGTEAEAWISKESLSAFPEFIEEIESYDDSVIMAWVNQFSGVALPVSVEELERLDMGDNEIVQSEFDDSSWSAVSLPHQGCFSDDFIPDMGYGKRLNGVFWYRRSVMIDDPSKTYTLRIGAIDDGDVAYVNGQKVGATLNWNQERAYEVPASLLNSGENTIAIKHYDFGGGSAVTGPIALEGRDGDVIDLAGEWSGLFYADLHGQEVLIYGLDNQDKLNDRPQTIQYGPNELASSLFNAMINPLVPYTIKGALWYQGESNVGRAKQYSALFPTLIKDWRNEWGNEFPFYFVQIAPFNYGNELSPALRDAQRLSLSTPKTGMAVTMDIGASAFIHPGNKQDIGDRLARLALANDYGQDIVPSGPLYAGHSIDGHKIIVSFDYANGLNFKGVSNFEIAGQDEVFVEAKATIVGNTIEVSASSVHSPMFVRYGWRDYVEGTLFNGAGLPASSFTSKK